MMTKIINGRVIRDGKIRNEDVYFADGKIISLREATLIGTPDEIIDAKGNYVGRPETTEAEGEKPETEKKKAPAMAEPLKDESDKNAPAEEKDKNQKD